MNDFSVLAVAIVGVEGSDRIKTGCFADVVLALWQNDRKAIL